jgi:NAD+ synthase
MSPVSFSEKVLRLDPEQETVRICAKIRELMLSKVKRRGLVVGISGGIDSSVTAALAIRALGRERVLGLEMPERHSSDDSVRLSSLLACTLGMETRREEISGILEAVGCYRKYDEAVRMVIPEYGEGWKSKLVISGIAEKATFTSFYLVARAPDGSELKKRLPSEPYRQIVAATNFKQRIRKMLEYYHADRLYYAVAGTPNRLEYDQGFFVKLGDGAADLKPIAHLYKSQVYQLAEYLGVPEEIRRTSPTTDTYSLPQGQDEFYFSLKYDKLDLCLFARNNGVAAQEVAAAVGLTPAHVEEVFRDIDVKRATTRYLHLPPQLVEGVSLDGH